MSHSAGAGDNFDHDFSLKSKRSSSRPTKPNLRSASTNPPNPLDSSTRFPPTAAVHTILPRETLNEIAARYGVDLPELLRWNPQIKDLSSLAPGQQIQIPTPSEQP